MAQPGRPLLLVGLLQAQQQFPTETRPFRPGQQFPVAGDSAAPPLYKNLGKLHMPVTTAKAQAQAYFDQGLRLVFSFNHAEAVRAFRAAARIDPGCAMCYWGEAVAPAHAAARQALQLADRSRPQEQALIRAPSRRTTPSRSCTPNR